MKKQPTVKALLRQWYWANVALTASLVLLAAVEAVDFCSKRICAVVLMSREDEMIQEPAEGLANDKPGDAWKNGRKLW